jgi:hypothetical protein
MKKPFPGQNASAFCGRLGCNYSKPAPPGGLFGPAEDGTPAEDGLAGKPAPPASSPARAVPQPQDPAKRSGAEVQGVE